MDYERYKNLMDKADFKDMKALSEFAKKCPGLYEMFRQQYQKEQETAIRLHNKAVTGI